MRVYCQSKEGHAGRLPYACDASGASEWIGSRGCGGRGGRARLRVHEGVGESSVQTRVLEYNMRTAFASRSRR